MRAYVIAADPTVTGANARVDTIYEGTRITFGGAAGGRAATIEVTMHPEAALNLALSLIQSAERHGKDTQRSVHRLAKRLSRATLEPKP
jgi:hypothetical protein